MLRSLFHKTTYQLRIILLTKFPFLISLYYRFLWLPKSPLDKFLNKFSFQNKEIFFIQIGSNDGFQNDPIHKFIKKNNWNGIMIEPQQKAFNILNSVYKKNKITVLNKAIDTINQKRKLYKLSFSDARWASGLSSFNKSHLEAMIKDGSLISQIKKENVTPPENSNDYITFDLVDCINFETLISTYSIQKIDLMHIDTEGYDFQIIKNFDFKKIHPKVILFEKTHLSDADYKECRSLLELIGYKLTDYNADTVAEMN